MPLYEYQCPKCGRFELIRKFSDEPVTECPTCGSPVQKLASAPAFHLKGSGWYATDYAKKGSGESGSKSGKAKSEEAKSSGKPDSSSTESGKSSTGDSAKSSTKDTATATPAAKSSKKSD